MDKPSKCSGCKLQGGCSCPPKDTDTASVPEETVPQAKRGRGRPRNSGKRELKKENENETWVYKSASFSKESRWVTSKYRGSKRELGCPGKLGLEEAFLAAAADDNIEGGLYVCKDCGKRFQKKKDLKLHTNKKARNKCSLCELCFLTTIDLDRHQKKIHPGVWDAKWSCEVEGCKQLVHGLRKMDEHLSTVHAGIDSKKGKKICAECGKRFWHGSSRNRHLEEFHGKKNYGKKAKGGNVEVEENP